MTFTNITSDVNSLQPAVAKGNTGINPIQIHYWKYLVWQAQKAIEELEAAEMLPPSPKLRSHAGRSTPQAPTTALLQLASPETEDILVLQNPDGRERNTPDHH